MRTFDVFSLSEREHHLLFENINTPKIVDVPSEEKLQTVAVNNAKDAATIVEHYWKTAGKITQVGANSLASRVPDNAPVRALALTMSDAPKPDAAALKTQKNERAIIDFIQDRLNKDYPGATVRHVEDVKYEITITNDDKITEQQRELAAENIKKYGPAHGVYAKNIGGGKLEFLATSIDPIRGVVGMGQIEDAKENEQQKSE